MSMPYTTEARPDTGLYNAKLGMWLFLAAELMFFGALFSSYAFLRTAADDWPNGAEILPVGVALVTTVAMILAAVFSAKGWSALRQKEGSRHATWMWGTIAAGVAAIVCIAIDHGIESSEGMKSSTNTFYACWYLMTGVHRIHVLAAVGYTLYLGLPGSDLRRNEPERYRNRVECLGLFWQFVALMWLGIFACFYVA